MSLAKKGARMIVVEGESYRWVVSPDDEPGLGIVVEREAGPGQRLLAWVKHGNTISPALVRKVILYALSRGWTPSERKKQMTFRLDDVFTGKCTSHDA
jgi:hypothetical protein